MKRFIPFLLLLLAAPLFAQPSQFANLMTGNATITQCSVNGSNTAILTVTGNTMAVGRAVLFQGLTACSFLNDTMGLTVSGSTSSQLQVTGFTHGTVSVTSDSGSAVDDTDMTCAGIVPCSTWPMPANPGKGNSWTDPAFGTTTWELPVGAANTCGGVLPIYSRVQGFSENDDYLMVTENCGPPYMDLYDATKTPPAFINRITTTDGSVVNSWGCDANWANTVDTRIYYIPCGNMTGSPLQSLQLRYVDVSTCTTGSCVLTPTVVHTFGCVADSYAPSPISPGAPCNVIETGSGAQGGMFDLTDTYFSFTGDISNGNGRAEVDFIRYNKSTDTVTTQEKWYTVCPGGVPSGCGVWNYPFGMQGYDDVRMNQHPDANYITVLWHCSTVLPGSPPGRGCGTEGFGPSYNFLGPISIGEAHQDVGFDVNGVPVWVGVQGDVNNANSDYYAFVVVDLTALTTSGIVSKNFYLPCTLAYGPPTPCSGNTVFLNAKVQGPHVSCTGTWSSVPGYCLYSIPYVAGYQSSNFVALPPSTTLGTAVTSVGSHTITPGSMANIGVGTQQLIDFGSANVESVTVSAVTGTTFTAVFANTHPVLTGSGTVNVSGGGYTVDVATGSNFSGLNTSSIYVLNGTAYPISQINSSTELILSTAASTGTGISWYVATPVSNLTAGDTQFGAMENFFLKIDTTATNGSNAIFYRAGRNMSIRDADYGAEPHAFVNRNDTAIVWGSNWNVDGGVDNGYYTKLSASAPQSGTPTFSPVAGTYTGTQSVTISATGGSVICYNTTGSPATNGTTGCTTGTLYTGAVSVSTSETLYAVSGGTGYTDSSVGSAAYTITGAPPPGVAPQLFY